MVGFSRSICSFFLTCSLLFLASCSYFQAKPSSTISFLIKGRKGKILFQKDILRTSESVGNLTQRVLQESGVDNRYEKICKLDGVTELMGLAPFSDGSDPKNYKSFGWCYFVDGKLHEVAPLTYMSDKILNDLVWAFSYSEIKDGQWVSQCIQDI